MSGLTHGLLFSGIGGPEVAAEMMGWENVFHCDINPFGRKVLDYWYPNSKSYEDITKTDFTEWRGKIDVLTGGFPCFVADTPVLTRRGFIPIEEVQVGDYVLSADKKYHLVECTMNHIANKIVYMRAQGMAQELKCTPNHPFYVRKKEVNWLNGHYETTYLPAEYIEAGKLTKDYKVGYPVYEGNDTSYSPAFWKLVGTWLADGWTDSSKRKSPVPQGVRGSRVNSYNHKVIICCGKKDISKLHHVIQKAGYKYTLSEDKATFRCIICDKWLCSFLQDFGKYAYGKHLSPQCFSLDAERKKNLLEGWFADGYKEKNGSVKITTVSERLAMDMAQIARDVYKCPVSISRKTCNRVCVIEGREVNERSQYCVTISSNSRYGFYEDGFVWCNIKSIREESEIDKVFNLSVNEEHSYNVYGIAVHNCQPFSVAGQRKGADDNRYLWPHMLRAIREIRPAWVVGENVAGILTMVQPGKEVEVGCQASLFGEDNRKRILLRQEYVVETICKDLEREGYSVQPLLIPACAVGAPHRRDRIFFVAHRTDARAEDVRQERENTILSDGIATHSDIYRHTPCETCEGVEGRGCENNGESEKREQSSQWANGFHGFSRNATDTNGERCDDRSDNREERPFCYYRERGFEESQSERDKRKCRIGEDGSVVADSQCQGRGQVLKEVQSEKPDGDSVDCNGYEWDAAYSNDERLSALGIASSITPKGREIEERCSMQYSCNDRRTPFTEWWQDFPTQSPVCRGNDGLPFNVDDLTISFTRWRQEAIKAYGNAIVPQVMYEIFRAIESTCAK